MPVYIAEKSEAEVPIYYIHSTCCNDRCVHQAIATSHRPSPLACVVDGVEKRQITSLVVTLFPFAFLPGLVQPVLFLASESSSAVGQLSFARSSWCRALSVGRSCSISISASGLFEDVYDNASGLTAPQVLEREVFSVVLLHLRHYSTLYQVSSCFSAVVQSAVMVSRVGDSL